VFLFPPHKTQFSFALSFSVLSLSLCLSVTVFRCSQEASVLAALLIENRLL